MVPVGMIPLWLGIRDVRLCWPVCLLIAPVMTGRVISIASVHPVTQNIYIFVQLMCTGAVSSPICIFLPVTQIRQFFFLIYS